MQQKSPMLRLWELSSQYHGGLIRAVISASVGVLCGMLPYFAAARIIIGLMNGNRESGFYVFWCIMAFAGYLLRSCLYALALSMSHILQKIPKKFIPDTLMHWADRYLDKRIQQLKQETIRQNWDKVYLDQALREIHSRQQAKEKAPSGE